MVLNADAMCFLEKFLRGDQRTRTAARTPRLQVALCPAPQSWTRGPHVSFDVEASLSFLFVLLLHMPSPRQAMRILALFSWNL